ncbi:hypothetical protein [Achromobacter ruhlandii]|uniref:hypothetical protein n=1 Tax=Achromobacter ruhlandii TaxID=72557 RepID=UPI000B0B7D3E|nr:hypothetical protein [Achromobacter ruhlandii]
MLAALRQHDPAIWRRHAPDLAQAQRDSAEHGYCVGQGDWHSDVHAVAVPMRTRVDGQTLVFNCGGAVTRLRPGDLRGRIARRQLTLVKRVEKMLEQRNDA